MTYLCGKNIRCGDCDEFTWDNDGVCDPLLRIEKMNASYFMEVKNSIDIAYGNKLRKLKKHYIKVNAKYKIGQYLTYGGAKHPIIEVVEDTLCSGHIPKIAYIILIYTRKGKPRKDGMEIMLLEEQAVLA